MPVATNPETKSQSKRKLVQIGKTVSLYEQTERLGLIIRPVKTIIDLKQVGKNLGLASQGVETVANPEGSTEQSGNQATMPDATTNKRTSDAIADLGGALRAKLITESDIRNKTPSKVDEYGPLICLPLPEKIKDNLRVNYSSADLGMAAVGAVFGQNIANPNKDGNSLAESMVGNASYVIRTLIAALPGGVGAVSQKLSGSIPNPFSAAIFEKVTPRKFSFNWTIQPQTPKESANLQDIINHLRYWSLPNPSKDRLILDVPYEWELSFIGTNFLYSFSRCFMSSIDIDYSPNGFNAFMTDGAPQSVTISIEFEEIFPLDKSTIDEGGNGTSSMRPSGTLAERVEDYVPSEEETKAIEQKAAQDIVVSETKYTEATTKRKEQEKVVANWDRLIKDGPKGLAEITTYGLLREEEMIAARDVEARQLESAKQNEISAYNQYNSALQQFTTTGKQLTRGILPAPKP